MLNFFKKKYSNKQERVKYWELPQKPSTEFYEECFKRQLNAEKVVDRYTELFWVMPKKMYKKIKGVEKDYYGCNLIHEFEGTITFMNQDVKLIDIKKFNNIQLPLYVTQKKYEEIIDKVYQYDPKESDNKIQILLEKQNIIPKGKSTEYLWIMTQKILQIIKTLEDSAGTPIWKPNLNCYSDNTLLGLKYRLIKYSQLTEPMKTPEIITWEKYNEKYKE